MTFLSPALPRASLRLRRLFLLLHVLAAVASVSFCGARAARAQSALPLIALDIAPAIVPENGGAAAAQGTVRRLYADTSRPLTIRITNGLAGSLVVPATVVIPSGATRAEFGVGAIDDSLLNGSRTALLTARAEGFYDTYFAVSVSDDESTFEMSISPAAIGEREGRATGRIIRAQNSANLAETITLSSTAPEALRFPASILFAAGQIEATFAIESVDNDLFDGQRTVTLTAARSRSGQFTTADVGVIDNELDLTIEVDSTISEGAGTSSFATISRTQAAAAQGALVIEVRSSDISELLGPAGFFLARNVTSTRLPLRAIDDLLVDGDQRVTLVAEAEGYNSDTAETIVTDNDTPEIQLSLNATAVSESGSDSAVRGVLRRNTSTTNPVVVSLRSSSARLSLPSSVEIPSGAVEARFLARAVDNAANEGDATVTVTASAPGFPTRSASLIVRDNDGPSLQIEVDEEVLEGSTTSARITRLNTSTSAPLSVTLTSSNPGVILLARAGSGVGSATLTGTIAAGQSSAAFSIIAGNNTVPTDLRASTISAASALGQAASVVNVRDDDDSAELRISTRTAANQAGQNFVLESAGAFAIEATVTRNTATTSELIVRIETGPDLIAPERVIIPFGQSSVTFFAAAVDDEIGCTDGDALNLIRPVVAGYTFVTQKVFPDRDPEDEGINPETNTVLVVDDEVEECGTIRGVTVQITPAPRATPRARRSIAEIDGANAATISVTRTDLRDAADLRAGLGLVVDLVSSAPTRARAVPGLARNVIPNGAPRAAVNPARIILAPGLGSRALLPLSTFNDLQLQGCTTLTITPEIIGYVVPSAPNTIIPVARVGDGSPLTNLIPGDILLLDATSELSLFAVNPRVIDESGASGVATGIVRRAQGPTGNNDALDVTVRTLNAAAIGVSPVGRRDALATLVVTIPAGQTEASFNVIANDNAVANGDVSAQIEATTECSTAVTRTTILVRDNEPASLSLRIGPPGMLEGGPANQPLGIISRSGSLSRPMVVSLRSSDTTELVVPATITIPAGIRQISFVPRVVDDTIVDGRQNVTVTATAAGARGASAGVVVLDNDVARR